MRLRNMITSLQSLRNTQIDYENDELHETRSIQRSRPTATRFLYDTGGRSELSGDRHTIPSRQHYASLAPNMSFQRYLRHHSDVES